MKAALGTLLLLVIPLPLPAAQPPSRWKWSSEIPAQFRTPAPRPGRSASAIDALFRPSRPTLPQLIAAIGQPDGLSRQFLYSFRESSSQPMEHGATLRFQLDDGGELHVQSADLVSIGCAIRYDSKGRGHLLYK